MGSKRVDSRCIIQHFVHILPPLKLFDCTSSLCREKEESGLSRDFFSRWNVNIRVRIRSYKIAALVEDKSSSSIADDRSQFSSFLTDFKSFRRNALREYTRNFGCDYSYVRSFSIVHSVVLETTIPLVRKPNARIFTRLRQLFYRIPGKKLPLRARRILSTRFPDDKETFDQS